MARHLHLDPFSGIAGDMLLAALVDLGAPVPAVEDAVRAVRFPWVEEIRLEFPPVSQGGVRGRRLLLEAPARGAPEATSYPAFRLAVASAPLSPLWGARALAALDALARAESAVHGISLDDVTFWGLGGFDTVDVVVGGAAALQWLAEPDSPSHLLYLWFTVENPDCVHSSPAETENTRLSTFSLNTTSLKAEEYRPLSPPRRRGRDESISIYL